MPTTEPMTTLPDYVDIRCCLQAGEAFPDYVSVLGRGELFQIWSITLCRMLLLGLQTSPGGTSHPLLADLARDLDNLMADAAVQEDPTDANA
jgi:hypothetical protein